MVVVNDKVKKDFGGHNRDAEPTNTQLSKELSILKRQVADVISKQVAEIEAQKAIIEEQNKQIDALKKDLRDAKIWTVAGRVDDLFEYADDLERALINIRKVQEEKLQQQASSPEPRDGSKTSKRVKKIRAKLKESGGRARFAELRSFLSISKSQFSKLLKRLDGRLFDVQRSFNDHREKILILRPLCGDRPI